MSARYFAWAVATFARSPAKWRPERCTFYPVGLSPGPHVAGKKLLTAKEDKPTTTPRESAMSPSRRDPGEIRILIQVRDGRARPLVRSMFGPRA